MSNYWVSQKRRFCEDCKCWIADHPTSIVSHEGGTKHFANAQRRLAEMRRRGAANSAAKRQEEEWVKQMEEAAMKDYREKDLGGGADIQARRVNAKKEKMMRERGIDPIALQMTGGGPSSHQPGPSFQRHQTDRSGDDRKLEQQEHQERADAAAAKEKAAAKERPPEPHMKPAQPESSTIGPEMPFRVFKPTTSGTKYHNKPRDQKLKMWYEAKTEQGVTYYWHVETKQSRWTAPPEGYFSIAEQEDVNRKHQAREMRKVEKIYEQQAIHGKEEEFADVAAEARSSDEDSEDDGPPGGAPTRIDHGPYGKWQVVEKKSEKKEEEKIDFQVPRKRSMAPAPPVIRDPAAMAPEPRVEFKFKQKAMPSLGNSSGGGEAFFKKRKTEGKRQFRRGNMDD